MLLPNLLVFFKNSETQHQALQLLEPMITKLGSQKSLFYLENIILTLYEEENEEMKSFLLSYSCFSLLQKYLGLDFIFQVLCHLFEAIRNSTAVSEKAEHSIKFLG